jgi:hypothetical protein
MGLIDLKTDLKSLRYGKDTLGGGYSGQPYIQKDIPDGFSTLGANEDFLLRGGINIVSDTKDDIIRLGKMFTDLKSPSGLLFIAKQQILSRTAVRTQTSGILNEGIYSPLNTLAQAGVNALGGHLKKQGINPFAQTGAYANNDDLYSVKVKNEKSKEQNRLFAIYDNITGKTSTSNWNFSGMDINVGANVLSYGGGPDSNLGIGKTNIRFASPDQRTGNQSKYYGTDFFVGKNNQKSINLNNNQEGGLKVNWLTKWTKTNIYHTPKGNIIDFGLPKFNVNTPQKGILSNIPTGSDTWEADKSNEDSSKYLKTFSLIGDQSKNKGVSGVYSKLTGKPVNNKINPFGKKLYNNSVYNAGATFPDGTNPHNFDQGTITYNQTMLFNSEANTRSIQDFRQVIRDTLGNTKQIEKSILSGALTKSPPYSNKQTDIRNQQGQPGKRENKNYSSYTNGVSSTADNKNTPIYLDEINGSAIGSPVGGWNDLVTFNIVPISGVGAMTFRAFLGSISDSFSGNVTAHKFSGRGENFYTYEGFDRKFSLSWTTAAQSKPELIPMYQKLSFLASNLAPIYKDGYMQGPLVKLSIGGYFRDMPGYITGLNYELSEESSWDIQINDNGGIDRNTSELPHIIKVSGFSFIPIPTYLPQQGAPMIDIWNGNDFSLAYNTHGATNDGRPYGTEQKGLTGKNTNGKFYDINTINGGYDGGTYGDPHSPITAKSITTIDNGLVQKDTNLPNIIPFF